MDKTSYQTEQERFWAGEFGSEYIARNSSEQLLASNLSFFSNALKGTGALNSVVEFGANMGMNLKAIRLLLPNASLNAVEINSDACSQLKQLDFLDSIFCGSIFDYQSRDSRHDLVLIKGVLIHVHPDFLDLVYEKAYESSERYVLLAEYYNPSPVDVMYRGHEGFLFKRDFAGEFLDKYPSTRLVDYGFSYHRDPLFPQDDITWFLIEK